MSQLSYPKPLRGGDIGSFAEHTVRVRMPTLTARVIVDNQFSAEINAALTTLQHDLPNGLIRHLTDTDSPDFDAWSEAIEPFVGQTWLEAPWLFAEIYHHRRILETIDYYRNWVDPFALQKRQALVTALDEIRPIAEQLPRWTHPDQIKVGLAELFALSMWGNQADLGLFPIGTERPSHETLAQREAATLIDHHVAAVNWVVDNQCGRVDLLLDNSGLELCSDLLLATFLLETSLAAQVVLHCKTVPYFVSDATAVDIQSTIAEFEHAPSFAVNRLAQQLNAQLDKGALVIESAPVWTLPQPYWALPQSIRHYFPKTTLLISKGDLNYRRWMGDLAWRCSEPATNVLHYVDFPLLLLRTLKSELLVGLPPTEAARLNSAETDWLTSGRYGVIQFHNPSG